MSFNFGDEAKMTNKELSTELAKLSPLTEAEVSKLLPRKIDKERYAQLLSIVQSSASQNKKVAELTDNFTELGGVAVKLLTKFLKPL